MMENVFITYTITAPVEASDANANGVIIAQAGAFGGWILSLHEGRQVPTLAPKRVWCEKGAASTCEEADKGGHTDLYKVRRWCSVELCRSISAKSAIGWD